MPQAHWGLVFGLGITQIVDIIAATAHGPIVGLIVDVAIAAVWVFFGLQAQKGRSWAFITGMIFYVIDALISLACQDWIGAAVHAYALFRIFPGLMASREYGSLMKAVPSGPYYGAPQAGVYPPPPQSMGYPQQPGGYPPQPGAYPPQPGAYPPQPGAYPQQSGQFPPPASGYPPQPGAYPQQQPPQQQNFGQNLDGSSSE
jgi:hypothetical protein